MPEKHSAKGRKMMVIEEVEKPIIDEKTPQILDESAKVSSSELIDNENIQLTDSPSIPSTKQTMSPFFWIIVPGIFILGVILGGIVFYQKGMSKGESVVVTASPTPTASTSATPSATVDLTKYSISVLNGSGISGEAGKVKTLLETAGFTVAKTGNAPTYDYTKTVIKAKSTVTADFIGELSKALGKSYSVGTTVTLATSSADTVQVIVGTTKSSE